MLIWEYILGVVLKEMDNVILLTGTLTGPDNASGRFGRVEAGMRFVTFMAFSKLHVNGR